MTTITDIIRRASKFNSFDGAYNYQLGCVQFSKWSIVLGDNDMFWMVTNKEASILIKSGYELAF